MGTNREYKEAALEYLKGNWPAAIIASAIYFVVLWLVIGSQYTPALMGNTIGVDAAVSGSGFLVAVLVLGPLSIGYANAFRLLCNTGNANVTANMVHLSTNRYLHLVGVYLLMTVKIILWSLLFIVPGVMKAFSYAMTPFIAVEHPEMSASEVLAKSSEMMYGHRMELFMLYLSFIGWFLLSMLTAFVGLIILQSYVLCSVVEFYNEIKGPSGPTNIILEQ